MVEKNNDGVISTYKRYKKSLKYFISGYLMNTQDVEDVCQETFLRTYSSSLENKIKQPKSFMYRVAKNLIFSDYNRVASKLTEYVDDIDLVDNVVTLENIEQDTLAQEKLTIMFESIASLPNKCRQVVIMRKIYGRSTKDIAIHMNISTTTVSNYITKGMRTYNDAILKYNNENSNKKHQKNTEKVKSDGAVK